MRDAHICSPSLARWNERKKLFIKRIYEDLDIGYLDRRILGLLKVINARKKSYTTSSCSGRVVVLDSHYPWERDEDNVVFKSHDLIDSSVLKKALEIKPLRRFWIQATGPILHIMTLDEAEALELIRIARMAGFKHSGVMGCSDKGWLVELVSGVQVTIPFKDNESIYIETENLDELVRLLNGMLEEGWNRITRLERLLRKEVDNIAPQEGFEETG